MLRKPLDKIVEADLQQLVTDRVQEGKQLEYKEALPGQSYEDKKEFLADSSALANSAGGLLIYGVSEHRENGRTTGLPSEIVGVSANIDEVVRRLENLLRDAIEPRIQGVRFHHVTLASGNYVLILQVPRSWSGPHVVDLQGHWRFYARNASGKYQMDLDEVRRAMTFADAVSQHVNRFRLDRLAKIVARETPVPLVDGACIVLHLIPLTLGDPGFRVSLSEEHIRKMVPISSSGYDYRINVDGLVTFFPNKRQPYSYLQVFRSGALEAADSAILQRSDNRIPGLGLERKLIAAVSRYFPLLAELGVSPPILLTVSLLGVRGYRMALPSSWVFDPEELAEIDRNDLILPDTLVEDVCMPAPAILKPSFDMIWNACGFPGSRYYDEDGNWTGDKR
ncbi:MAG: helix-turn-helix domain-containing protein [Bacillota bacterium]